MTTPGEAITQMSPDERRALLAQLLREKARALKTRHPLSYGQRAMWFLAQLAPESAAYHTAFAATIRAPVDVGALRRAFQAIVDRHEALRTAFVYADGGSVQEVYGALDLNCEVVDATGDSDDELRARVQAAYQQPFDLTKGDVLRVNLFTRGPSDHVLLLTVHHIAIDGWSLGLILNEFQALYQAELGGAPAALAAPRQYSEFTRWQAAMIAGVEGQRLREYWHARLAGELPLLNLPLDRPRPQQQSFRGTSLEFTIDAPLLQQLRALAKTERTTLYAVLLASFYVLLHRYTDQTDIIVGSPMAARSRQEFQQTVGYMVSPVALRADLSGNPPFRQFLAQVRQTVLEAIAHQDYPFALLVEELRPPREPGRSPIFEVLFNLQKVERLGQLTVSMTRASDGAPPSQGVLPMEVFPLRQEEGQFDLSIDTIEMEHQVMAAIRYSPDLFEHATIERMVGHLQTLLAGAAASPDTPIGELPLLTADERRQILGAWNATAFEVPARCVHDLFAEQAARTPERIAAAFEGASLSYAELDRRSNQLAQRLRALGIGPDTLVGIYLDRSLDMLVALLGVLKAGGAYVPLDPTFPRERLAYMLEDAAAPVLITQQSLVAGAPPHAAQVICMDSDWGDIAGLPAEPPAVAVAPEHLAYVIYTSGSTGRPKGVQLPHSAVVNFLLSMRERPGMAASDTLLAVTTLSFDIAVLELFLPLIVGGRTQLVSRQTASSGDDLARALAESGATVMQATPVTWRLLLAAGWRPARPMRALCGGEALPPDLAAALLDAGVELWNMYGPTETTVWSAIQRVERVDGVVPVGRPIGNTQIYVLSREMQPTPIGVPGELYIGGAGVARGYLNRPELTAERFVRDPFSDAPGARLYRTGDVARWRSDGTIEVLGRTDHQVKIRGFRIELGEIEAVLREHAAVRDVVVVDRDAPAGGRRLVAYLTAAGERAPTSADLRRFLRERLPEYMIPSLFVALDAIPLTPNGKVDRGALPAPERERVDSAAVAAPPTTEMERLVAQVWQEALGIERVSTYDNFFDLGGHSLLVVETLARLEQETGVKLHPATVRVQTLGQIAASYEAQQRGQEQPQPRQPAGLSDRLFGTVRRIVGG